MASKLEQLAATALAALGWWFGSGLHPVWWLAWLAPLPVLWLAPRVGACSAAGAAFVAFAIGGFDQWGYLHGCIGLGLPIIILWIGTPALVFALCVSLFRRLLLRRHALAAALALPTGWIAIEYISSLVSPHGTFGSIAYAQMDALPVVQLASITGIWGIGFLVLLVPASAAVWLDSRTRRRSRVAIVMASLTTVVAVAYGVWRMHVASTATLRVGLVSLEQPVRPALRDPSGQALEARYARAIGRLADAGARAVVIPETSFATTGATVPGLAELARQRGLTVAAGIDARSDPHAERNTLMVFGPDTGSPMTYSKHHLIPGFEHQYEPGDDFTMLSGTPRIGLAICKDMDFHDIGQAYAARDAQLLLVPAWDFGVDGWLHSRMAIMRGVESGFAVARAARSGRLTLSDDRGRVVAEVSSETDDAEVVGDVPLHGTRTLYARWGDWFAWLALAGLTACIALAFGPRCCLRGCELSAPVVSMQSRLRRPHS